ncbi:MAG: HD domain-containing protein [Lachnospiraceae bacterium]|nr:HD domain-containing protein [Lachnospiraceae bacterium]
MQVTSFAAVYIGSYDIILEIFEISKRTGITPVDTLRHRLELGKEVFTTGKISPASADALCSILLDYKRIMDGYRVDGFRVIASSAMREAQNNLFILGKIQLLTGFQVELLSNSELRFLSCKSVASLESHFNSFIEKGTAIVDLDSGSIQISLFDKNALINTQNIRIGTLRVRERLSSVSRETTDYPMLVEEYIQNEISSYKKMYLKDRKIENVILLGDVFTWPGVLSNSHDMTGKILNREQFQVWYEKLAYSSPTDISRVFGLNLEYASLIIPAAIIYHRFVEALGASSVWLPGADLVRGLAYEFAEEKKLLKMRHDFGNDILMAGRHISKRYAVGKAHVDNVDMMATAIFDATRKAHGRGERARLLLRMAVLLHDVGKYINCNGVPESNYNIIMANEIIGLSHTEREMVALITKYNTLAFPAYPEMRELSSIDKNRYLMVAELTAILRVANSLDRSHKQKVQEIRASLKEQKFTVTLRVNQDYTLERGTIEDKLEFFGEVFGFKPELKVRREG